jgi:hypothetical protein
VRVVVTGGVGGLGLGRGTASNSRPRALLWAQAALANRP